MPPTPRRALIPGAPRVARAAVAAGLVTALCAAGPLPVAFAADASAPAAQADDSLKSAHDKLGPSDAELLAEARAAGDKTVTMTIVTEPGRTEQVAGQLDAVKGGSVGRAYDQLGYVRATVPTNRADAAIAAAAKLSAVHGIDLRQEIRLDPRPVTTNNTSAQASSGPYAGPGKKTPARNPYNPSFETGAVDFVQHTPKADGRGITIGVVDSGVDLAHPALRKTTTGQRKIVDWVTSTDPVVDGDETWRAMTAEVSGSAFTYGGRSWRAPAGSYRINVFHESATRAGELRYGNADGDANRDGDTTDDWGVLYDAEAGTVTVDVDDDGDFTDDKPMKPYKNGYRIGYFGKDKPSTKISERQPFVVEIRKDVPMDPLGGEWAGKKSDFVNIGLVASSHGTHVAGITAANGLFGGKMNGAAPGARIVSSRACLFGPFCSTIAMDEGMIDLVVNRGVDVVNMSIGSLPAVNDGHSARAELYSRLIDKYGVQLVISAGNEGPGANTVNDPAIADKAVSVGAGISKETWAANYGSGVKNPYSVFPWSSGGPREDGGFAPTLVAPGSSVNTIPTWMPSEVREEAGWKLPPGYAMYNGTSMASPQAAGAIALLLSAAERQRVDLPPARLRTALTSTARHIEGLQAYEEGTGRIDIGAAWKSIKSAEKGAPARRYTVKAPVDTALDQELKTPGFGTGVYDREGGLKAGQKKTYGITLTRTSGPDKALAHDLRLRNNAGGTFALVGPKSVRLGLNKPVTVKVRATPKSAGIKSARLEIDDPTTVGVDRQILTTVVVSTPAKYTFSASDKVRRNSVKSYFVTVPPGAGTLEVALDGLKDGNATYFSAIHPYGTPMEDDDDNTPDVAAYPNPQPGVWEIAVYEDYYSERLDNAYDLKATVYEAAFDPETVTVPEGGADTPSAVSWRLTNRYAAVRGTLQGGPLGSSRTLRPTVAAKDTWTTTVVVPEGATSLDVSIGGVSDPGADLDLTVSDADGDPVAEDADGDSEESVSVADPAAGTYTIEVFAFDVPSGTTAFDHHDVFSSPALGSITVDGPTSVKIATGGSRTVSAQLRAATAPAEGRDLIGEVRLVSEHGTVVSVGTARIEKVTP
ncbi:S8 family serine peptidase [Streptomyces sp. NPDC012510]|uniref:S8 family serine peptidase n=1 Tax=Streptomyces sp. NPDC012510 TaxID=3364838 RepID=UPI0036EDE3DB